MRKLAFRAYRSAHPFVSRPARSSPGTHRSVSGQPFEQDDEGGGRGRDGGGGCARHSSGGVEVLDAQPPPASLPCSRCSQPAAVQMHRGSSMHRWRLHSPACGGGLSGGTQHHRIHHQSWASSPSYDAAVYSALQRRVNAMVSIWQQPPPCQQAASMHTFRGAIWSFRLSSLPIPADLVGFPTLNPACS